MVVFTDPNLTTTDTFVPDFVKQTSDSLVNQSGSIMGIGFLLAILLVAFGGSKSFGFPRALVFATFLGTTVSLIMAKLGWITSNIIYLNISLFIVAIIILFITEK